MLGNWLGITLKKNICQKEEDKIVAETNRGSYYKQEEWLEVFLDNKSAFSDGSESRDSDNDDENSNKSIEAFVHRCSSE